MKKSIVILILLFLSACSSLGADLKQVETEAVKIDTEISAINSLQELSKSTEQAKYKYTPEYEKDTIKYQVNEYITPKGEAGYVIEMKKEVKGKLYLKRQGYGPEADKNTEDWHEVID